MPRNKNLCSTTELWPLIGVFSLVNIRILEFQIISNVYIIIISNNNFTITRIILNNFKYIFIYIIISQLLE